MLTPERHRTLIANAGLRCFAPSILGFALFGPPGAVLGQVLGTVWSIRYSRSLAS